MNKGIFYLSVLGDTGTSSGFGPSNTVCTILQNFCVLYTCNYREIAFSFQAVQYDCILCAINLHNFSLMQLKAGQLKSHKLITQKADILKRLLHWAFSAWKELLSFLSCLPGSVMLSLNPGQSCKILYEYPRISVRAPQSLVSKAERL